MSSDEDFGGPDPIPRKRPRDLRPPGQCRECGAPVKINKKGKPLKVCPTHAARDAARKATFG